MTFNVGVLTHLEENRTLHDADKCGGHGQKAADYSHFIVLFTEAGPFGYLKTDRPSMCDELVALVVDSA